MQRFEPALYVEGFDVVRDLSPPLRDEVGANDMFRVKHGALGFGAERIRAEVMGQVMFRQGIESNARVLRRIDAGEQAEPVDFPARIPLFREIAHRSDSD